MTEINTDAFVNGVRESLIPSLALHSQDAGDGLILETYIKFSFRGYTQHCDKMYHSEENGIWYGKRVNSEIILEIEKWLEKAKEMLITHD